MDNVCGLSLVTSLISKSEPKGRSISWTLLPGPSVKDKAIALPFSLRENLSKYLNIKKSLHFLIYNK